MFVSFLFSTILLIATTFFFALVLWGEGPVGYREIEVEKCAREDCSTDDTTGEKRTIWVSYGFGYIILFGLLNCLSLVAHLVSFARPFSIIHDSFGDDRQFLVRPYLRKLRILLILAILIHVAAIIFILSFSAPPSDTGLGLGGWRVPSEHTFGNIYKEKPDTKTISWILLIVVGIGTTIMCFQLLPSIYNIEFNWAEGGGLATRAGAAGVGLAAGAGAAGGGLAARAGAAGVGLAAVGAAGVGLAAGAGGGLPARAGDSVPGRETRLRRVTDDELQRLISAFLAGATQDLNIGGAQGVHAAFAAMMRRVGRDLIMALRQANGQQLWPTHISVAVGSGGRYPVYWDVFDAQCRQWLRDYEMMYRRRAVEGHREEILVPSRSTGELLRILDVIRFKVSPLYLEPLRYELLLEVMVFMDKVNYAPLNSFFVSKFIMDASSGYAYTPGPSPPMLPAVVDTTDGTEIFPAVSAQTPSTFACAAGIYDRIITSFIEAVNAVCCSRSDCDVPLLSGLCAILRLSDLTLARINTYIGQWIAVPDSSYAALTPEQRKDNMITFIVAKAASGVQERDVLARIRDYIVRIIDGTPALSALKFECIDKEDMIVDPEACETEAAAAGAGEAAGGVAVAGGAGAGAAGGAGEAAGGGAGAGAAGGAGEAAGGGAGTGAVYPGV